MLNTAVLNQQGFSVYSSIYTGKELLKIHQVLNQLDFQSANVRKSKDLFAIRHLSEIAPSVMDLVINSNFRKMISSFGKGYKIVKSLYFDKPPQSNWFVFWHQDLTISVRKKTPMDGFINWTNKNGFIGVQPPIAILEDTITCRIHLDDCDQQNGGLRVLPHSHQQDILRSQQIADYQQTCEAIQCEVKAGGVLLMKPLLLHASSKNNSQRHRRVIHLELTTLSLPTNMAYRESTEL